MRLEVTKKTDLVLRAFCCLGRQETRLTGSDIADRIDVSRQTLPKLMEPLVKAGWVESTPGPTGGYQLIVELSEVSLLDVIEAVEGPTEEGRCVLRGTPCPAEERCAMHDAWQTAKGALLTKLDAMSVEEVSGSASMCGVLG